MTDKLPPLDINIPVYTKTLIDLEKEAEQRKKEEFERIIKALDDAPKQPVMCRCYMEKEE